MQSRLPQLIDALHSGVELDLREILRGVSPDAEDELILFIERYTELQIKENGSIEFEEYRRAIPWIFDSDRLLKSAVESVVFTAVSNCQNPISICKAIARGHPLASTVVDFAIERLTDSNGYILPTAEIRPLPVDFGPQDLDGGLRYSLTKRVRRGRDYAIYDGTDSMAADLGISKHVLVWIKLNRNDSDLKGAREHPAASSIDLGIGNRRGFLAIREDGVAMSGEDFISYESPVEWIPIATARVDQCVRVGDRVRLIRNIAMAVETAHSTGQACGDLSPRNLFSNDACECKVALFPKPAPNVQDDPESHDTGTEGLISFVSPEQYSGADPDPRTDVYQLGALLLWMLTGTFANGSDSESAHRFLVSDLNIDPVLLKGVPHGLRDLVLKSVSRTPDTRPISVTVFRTTLDRWINREPTEESPMLGTKTRSLVRRRPLAVSSLVACILALMSTGLWMAFALAELKRERQDLAGSLAEANRRSAQYLSIVKNTRELLRDLRHAVMLNEAGHSELLVLFTSVWHSMEAISPDARSLLRTDTATQAVPLADELWHSGQRDLESAIWQLIASESLVIANEPQMAELYLLRAVRLFEGIDANDDSMFIRLRSEIQPGHPPRSSDGAEPAQDDTDD
ncbi:MAG: hypothetical protein AB8F26_02590 [Phycisphaerales bacterium]